MDLRHQPEVLTFCENSFPADVFKGLGTLKELRLRAVTGECNCPKQTFSRIPSLDRLYIEGYGMATSDGIMPVLPVEISLISNLRELEIIYSKATRISSDFLKWASGTLNVVGVRNSQLLEIDGAVFSNTISDNIPEVVVKVQSEALAESSIVIGRVFSQQSG